MTANEIESAIEHAINALGLAKLALSKSALPVFSQSDELRKARLGDDPRASRGDVMKTTQAAMADLNSRMDRLEAGRDMDLQSRKTYTIAEGAR
jgi:hypothetical protein